MQAHGRRCGKVQQCRGVFWECREHAGLWEKVRESVAVQESVPGVQGECRLIGEGVEKCGSAGECSSGVPAMLQVLQEEETTPLD